MGVRRVVLHIGSDKAGSSAIQQSLNANRAWYKGRGVHIPTTGFLKMGGHANLFANLDSPSMRTELKNETQRLDADTVLLSWEGIHFYGRPQRRDLRALLERCFPGVQVHVVYYVREQLGMIQSGLLQQVKQLALSPATLRQLSLPLNEIPEDLRRNLLNDRRCFSERVWAWRKSLPDAKFLVRLYDRRTLIAGDVVDDFHDALQLQLDDEYVRPVQLANASLTAEAVVVLDEYFRHVWAEEDRRRIVDSIQSFRGGTSNFLHESSQLAVAEYFAEDNSALVRSYPACEAMLALRPRPPDGPSSSIVEQCRSFMVDQSNYPTQMVGSLKGEQLGSLNLVSGWSGVNKRGTWSIGETSVLQFRPRSMHFGGFSPGMTINIHGKYPGRRVKSDELLVNGQSFGPTDVFDRPILVPIELFDSTYRVRIEFRHHHPRRGTTELNDRQMWLDGLDYSVLSPQS